MNWGTLQCCSDIDMVCVAVVCWRSVIARGSWPESDWCRDDVRFSMGSQGRPETKSYCPCWRRTFRRMFLLMVSMWSEEVGDFWLGSIGQESGTPLLRPQKFSKSGLKEGTWSWIRGTLTCRYKGKGFKVNKKSGLKRDGLFVRGTTVFEWSESLTWLT